MSDRFFGETVVNHNLCMYESRSILEISYPKRVPAVDLSRVSYAVPNSIYS